MRQQMMIVYGLRLESDKLNRKSSIGYYNINAMKKSKEKGYHNIKLKVKNLQKKKWWSNI